MGNVFMVVAVFVFAVLLFVGLAAVLAYPMSWAWNGSMPAMFGLPKIGWFEAFTAQALLIFLRGAPVQLKGVVR